MVSAKREDKLALASMFVGLLTKLLGHGTDGSGFSHALVLGIGWWDEVGVDVDRVVVVNIVVKIISELVEQASLYQGGRGGVYSLLALFSPVC